MNWLLLGGFLLTTEIIWAEAEKKKDEPAKKEAVAVKKEEPKAKKEESKGEAKKVDAQKKEEADQESGAKSPHASTNENALFPDKEVYTKAEVDALREVLDKKSTQLDLDIDTQVKYLESLKVQTEEHLKRIEAARTEIADFMNTRDEKEEGKLKKLARFYEAMDAEQAAPLLKDVNDELAIKIFDRMDAKKAGTILAQLPATRAARLTTQFPKLRLQVERTQAEARQ
jgi:flagellar motility protein MotE (MotC chaperone)